MALYHKWYVKKDFAYVLTFFSLISDSLGSVWNKLENIVFNFIIAISIFQEEREGTKKNNGWS